MIAITIDGSTVFAYYHQDQVKEMEALEQVCQQLGHKKAANNTEKVNLWRIPGTTLIGKAPPNAETERILNSIR